VLAAGDGKRLQPYVREMRGDDLPKQYVSFFGQCSMLEQTFRRVEMLIPAEQILTIVGKHHPSHPEVQRQLANRHANTVIVQPQNKETGPGIFLPLMHLYKRDTEAIVAVFPSDHFILEEERFMDHVALAARAVAHDPSRIILLAMEAHGPEVEYGYILPRTHDGLISLWGMHHAAKFVEKPSLRLAQELIEAGGLCNTMIMVFKVRTLLEMMQRLCPTTYLHFVRIFDALGTPVEAQAVESVYQTMEPMNFSKGVLEKITATHPGALAVLPVLEVFWSDWGSPQRLVQVQGILEHAAENEPTPRPAAPSRKPNRSPHGPLISQGQIA
jgi:mannose-1-phosphate guanylyltransferase